MKTLIFDSGFFDLVTAFLKCCCNRRPFERSAFRIDESHALSDHFSIRSRKRNVEEFLREVFSDMVMSGVVKIQVLDIMAQSASCLNLHVRVAGVNDHCVEVLVIDVD